MHVIAGKAVAFGEALKPEFRDYAQKVVKNAKVLADAIDVARLQSGFRRNGYSSCPARSFTDGQNRQSCGESARSRRYHGEQEHGSFDPQKPLVTSGVRIGSPAVTTRGLGVTEMKKIVELMDQVIQNLDSEEVIGKVKAQVHELTRGFPLYPHSFRYGI